MPQTCRSILPFFCLGSLLLYRSCYPAASYRIESILQCPPCRIVSTISSVSYRILAYPNTHLLHPSRLDASAVGLPVRRDKIPAQEQDFHRKMRIEAGIPVKVHQFHAVLLHSAIRRAKCCTFARLAHRGLTNETIAALLQDWPWPRAEPWRLSRLQRSRSACITAAQARRSRRGQPLAMHPSQ